MKSDNQPFFSFVTATYNRSDYLPQLIGCMSKQTFKDFEIIVVDDGSTDTTPIILDQLSSIERRLRFLRQTNQERGAARNNGIRNALGMYIVFVDSDDTFDENHLESLHSTIQKNDFPDFVCNRFDMIRNGHSFNSAINHLKAGWYDYRLLLSGNVIGMYHAVRRANPSLVLFEEDRSYAILEDWMFNMVNLRHNRILLADDLTYHLHDHEGRSMRSDHQEIVKRKFKAAAWIFDKIELDRDQTAELNSHVEYFAAVHNKMDRRYGEAYKHLLASVRYSSWKTKHLIFIIKLSLGFILKKPSKFLS